MDSSVSDEGKLFVGGIAWGTTDGALRDHFTQYGEVTHAVIARVKATGQPRGFGFVVFADPTVADSVLSEKHAIDGRPVEVKKALSREKQQNFVSRNLSPNASKDPFRHGDFRTKKIFVGGLPSTLTKAEFMQYFVSFGEITDAVIMFDQATGRSRGFGFITFDTEDAVDTALNKNYHELNSKLVEVKRAMPKEASTGFVAHVRSPNAHGSYSGGTINAFGAPMDVRAGFQLPPAIGGYPSYSGLGGPLGYGYRVVNSAHIYGGVEAYPIGNFQNATAIRGSSAGAFGEQTATSNGYFGGAGFLEQPPWVSPARAYGALPYGMSPNYGVPYPWSTPVINAPLGPSPRGMQPVAGYSNPLVSEGSYTDPGRTRTVNKDRRNFTKSYTGHKTYKANEVGHHRADGEGTNGRLYNSTIRS